MKTKLIIFILLFSVVGIFAQQKAKVQKPDESGFIEVDEVPVLISKIKPSYPEIARLAGIEGTVYLKVLVDENGNVVKTKVEQGAKEMLDNSALQAAQKAKFSPAMLNNKPVKVWVVLPIAFKLEVDNKAEAGILKYGELVGPIPSHAKAGDPDINDFILVEKFPEMIESANPQYPEIAKRAGITGKVFVKVLIGKEGTPKKAIVVKSDSELFNQSAVEAAMKSKFTPAINKGEAIAVWIVLPYKFNLDPADMESKSFDKLEDAEKYYQGYINGLVGSGSKTEKIENILFYGDKSALYKIIGNSYDKYSFITRKGLNVVKITMNTLDDLKLAVKKNMDDTFKKLEIKNAKKK
jgi:TonB family protein